MIYLKYSEPLWLGYAVIGLIFLFALIVHFIERSMWTKEDKRLIELSRKTKPSARTEGKKTI